MRYAYVEQSLGEVDRSRAIYAHAAHLANPTKDKDFWDVSLYVHALFNSIYTH